MIGFIRNIQRNGQILVLKWWIRVWWICLRFDNHCNTKLVKKGLEIIHQDALLRRNYKNFKKNKIGTDKRLNDPSNPKNWGAIDTSKNISAKFIDTKDYKIYLKNLGKINQQSKRLR